MTDFYIGIDPGRTGGMAVITSRGVLETVKAKEIDEVMEEVLPSINIEAWIEDVHGMAGDSPKTADILCRSAGQWKGFVLYALHTTPNFIAPQKWQTRFARCFGDRWCPSERKERKNYIWNKTKELFPNNKILKDLADAVAIAWLAKEGKL